MYFASSRTNNSTQHSQNTIIITPIHPSIQQTKHPSNIHHSEHHLSSFPIVSNLNTLASWL